MEKCAPNSFKHLRKLASFYLGYLDFLALGTPVNRAYQMTSRLLNSTAVLFRHFKCGSLSLNNRIVMAPMTRSFCPEQIPSDAVASYYRKRVEGGVGLIITEGASPEHEAASNDSNVPSFFGKNALDGWAKVLKEVKGAGGRIIPQLWHVGAVRRPGAGAYPNARTLSPSGLVRPGKQVGEPMTDSEIADVIAAFVKSANYAKKLGFDGIEIHGASGYLIDQFFWKGTNLRKDQYGGSLKNRVQFAAEIIHAIRQSVGQNFPILLRFSQWKQQDYKARLAENPSELSQFLEPLTNAGVDIFDCSTRRFWEPEFPESDSDLNLAGWTRKLSGQPTITVGSVSLDKDFITTQRFFGAETTSIDRLIEMMERGDFDLVAIGRALLANPDWANKVKAGRFKELKSYTPDVLTSLY